MKTVDRIQIEELRTALRMAIDYLMNRHEADEIFMHSIRDVLQRTAPCLESEEIPYLVSKDAPEDDRYLDIDRPAEADEGPHDPLDADDEDIPF